MGFVLSGRARPRRPGTEKTAWNVTQASKLLGISRDTLRYRIEKYKLTRF